MFTDEEPLAAELGRLDLSPPRPRMLRRHDEDQLVEQSGRHALLAGPKRVPAHDPEVHLVPSNPLLDEGGVAKPQAEHDSWVFALERCNDAWEHVDPRCRAGADDQGAALELAEIGHGLAGTGDGREQS